MSWRVRRPGSTPNLDGEVCCREDATHAGHTSWAAAGRPGDTSVGHRAVTAAGAVGEARECRGDASEQALGQMDPSQHLDTCGAGGPRGHFAVPGGARDPHRGGGGDDAGGADPVAAPDAVIGLFEASAAGR